MSYFFSRQQMVQLDFLSECKTIQAESDLILRTGTVEPHFRDTFVETVSYYVQPKSNQNKKRPLARWAGGRHCLAAHLSTRGLWETPLFPCHVDVVSGWTLAWHRKVCQRPSAPGARALTGLRGRLLQGLFRFHPLHDRS